MESITKHEIVLPTFSDEELIVRDKISLGIKLSKDDYTVLSTDLGNNQDRFKLFNENDAYCYLNDKYNYKFSLIDLKNYNVL
jgi:hypothetical protein